MSDYTDLARLVTFRPLSTPLPAPGYSGSYRSPFSASWSSTVEILAREIKHLQPRMAVLELDMREQDFRIDGMPRADRGARTPGVVLSLMGTTHGDMRYPAHYFHHWQDNIRALALGLEALRKVDRYRINPRGEQYAGFKALPSPQDAIVERGRQILREHGGDRRAALRATHPDTGGNEDDFKALTAALEG